MTVALGLLAGAVLVSVLGPLYLRGTVSPRVRPGAALTGWVVSLLVVLGAAAGGAVVLVLPHNESADGLIGMAAACVNNGQPVWEHILRLAGAGLVVVALLRVLFVALRALRHESSRRRSHLSMLRLVARAEPDDSSLLWLEQATPVAYSLGGRHGAIVATTGVSELSPSAHRAILAHERAHLRGRHHVLVLFVSVLARALPFVPLFRAAPATVRVLVELAADATAARHCGPGPVRAALRAVTGDAVPAGSLAMSREAVELRMHWLAPAHTSRGGVRHRVGYAAAAFASVSPAILGVGLVAGLVLLYCLGAGTG